MEEFKLFDTVEVCFKEEYSEDDFDVKLYFNGKKMKGFVFDYYTFLDKSKGDFINFHIITGKNKRTRVKNIISVYTTRMVLIEKYDWRMENAVI